MAKVNKKLVRFKRMHRILVGISAIFVILSVWLLSLDPKNDANAGWNADMWLNNSFWEQNPSNGNIITALFGNGYPGSSPYNTYWDGFCLPNKITFVQSTTQLQNIVRDTIYVIKPGTYNLSTPIELPSCSAIVGMGTGETTFVGNNGIFTGFNKSNIILDNINISGANNKGIDFSNISNSTLNNIDVYGATNGIYALDLVNNRFNWIRVHNNTKGIYINGGRYNFVSNSEIFNNELGLYINNSFNNVSNNNQIYNNEYGISIAGGEHNSINNDQIYNNDNGITIDGSLRNLINNSHIYSNTNGIDLSSNNYETLLMSGNIYNNYYGIKGGKVRYYNTVGIFANAGGNSTQFITGGREDESNYVNTTDLLTLLNPNVGEIKSDLSMNRFFRTYPVSSDGIKFLNPLTSFVRGRQHWIPQKPIKYIAGKQIIKQANPLWFGLVDTSNWSILLKEHNPKYFIASIDSERSELDDSIVNYYYGDYGEDSEFTKNWNEKNCNINVMTVKYITNQTEFYDNLLATYMPMGHTIYVLMSGTYNVTDSIILENDCTAIVNYKGNDAKLEYYPGLGGSYPVIKVNAHENNILDGLVINGRLNSSDNILFDRFGEISSDNNTVNNVQSFKSLGDGIQLGSLAKYNTIMNSQFWNNKNYGIEIYQGGEFNIINNSMAYNNDAYGIRFGNKSKFNSINNSQSFNNGIGGIFSDLQTESNIINNTIAYNNSDFGINFKWSSGNVLHSVSSYNNNIGINIEDDSAINNVYLGDLTLFGNTSGNLYGTNGNDIFLKSANFTIPGLDLGSNTIVDNPIEDNSNNTSTSTPQIINICTAADILACAGSTGYRDCFAACFEGDTDDLLDCIEADPASYATCINNYTISTPDNNINIRSLESQVTEFSTNSSIETLSADSRYAAQGLSDITFGNHFRDWATDYDCSNFTVVQNADFSTGKYVRNLDSSDYEGICTGWNTEGGVEYSWSGDLNCCIASGDDLSSVSYNDTPICGHTDYTTNCSAGGGVWNSVYYCCENEENIDDTFMCSSLKKLVTGENMDITAEHYTLDENENIVLDPDTIFILPDGAAQIDYPIVMSKCSAVIGGDDTSVEVTGGIANLFTFPEGSEYAIVSHINITVNNTTSKILNFVDGFKPYTVVDSISINGSLLDDSNNYAYVNWDNSISTGYIKYLPTYTIQPGEENTPDENSYGTIVVGDSMSCSFVTTPQDLSLSQNLFFQNGVCSQRGVISTWDTTLDITPVNYLFGNNIKYQTSPIGYFRSSMSGLDNQYIPTSYIGEVNPIIYTDPGAIWFDGANTNDIATGINYEIGVHFANQGLLNHNFDIALNITKPDNIEGHLQIMRNGSREDIGTGASDLDYRSVEKIRIVVTMPANYLQEVEGTIYIGTPNYGSNSEIFWIQTMADPTPPSIRWIKNINNGGVWTDSDHIWQVKTNGKYNVSTWYDYVDTPNDCNDTIDMKNYTPFSEINLKDYAGGAQNLNGKYVCIYVKDNTSSIVTTGVSNQIKISSVDFVDDIIPGPVYYDSVNVLFNNVYEYGYTWVVNKAKCNANDTEDAKWLAYNRRFILNSEEYNNKYMCVYATDVNGDRRFFTSENSANIRGHGNVVRFNDGVNPSWNQGDTISIEFSGDVEFAEKKYKWVSNILECSNTGDMINYSGDIVINHQYLNGYYLCLYTLESGTNIENYLISPDFLRVDVTSPHTPTILVPVNNSSTSYLVIEMTGNMDDDSGIAGYEYQISKDLTFMDIYKEGFITISGNIFSPKFDGEEGQYFLRLRSIDIAGNISDERDDINYVSFNYITTTGFKFEDITGADLGRNYRSNSITIEGLAESGTLDIQVTRGTLYKNGISKGTGATVQNGDNIIILMKSSDKLGTKVTTNLIMANKILERSITTKEGDPILTKYNISDKDKLAVEKIFNSMKTMYKDDGETLELFYTMKNMLKDEIDLGKDNVGRLEYLLYLVTDYLGDAADEGGKIHTAPNCKKYEISYNSSKDAYYSPDMMVINGKISYFADITSLLRFIDSKNIGGDCNYHIYTAKTSYKSNDSNRFIAPNGKVYEVKFTDIGYTSPDLATTKYFASMSELRSYISKNNAAITLLDWDHTVDKDFEPVKYTAPNGKEYIIYHTNKGYMSYKLMSVKYFEKIEALQIYINKNNPK